MFYICKQCGNLVGMIFNSGVEMVCCDETMDLLVANTVEASKEKHIPVVKKDKDSISVYIGSVEHPMEEKHYIQWIYLETKKGGQRKSLLPKESPSAKFVLIDDEAVAAYAYCNLHGLWKTSI